MTRIVILGGPKTGKTTLAQHLVRTEPVHHLVWGVNARSTDDLIAELAHLGKDAWSEASLLIAARWFKEPGPWIIEGVAVTRALRKWRAAHDRRVLPPVDRVIRLTTPHVALVKGQAAMAKGEKTVWDEVEPWLRQHGVSIQYGDEPAREGTPPRAPGQLMTDAP